MAFLARCITTIFLHSLLKRDAVHILDDGDLCHLSMLAGQTMYPKLASRPSLVRRRR